MITVQNKSTQFFGPMAAMLRKEFRQFFNNSFMPKICVLFPLMVMLIMPLVTNMEVRHVGVVVVDMDHSPFSRAVTSSLNASEYLGLSAVVSGYDEAIEIIERGNADVIVEIPAGYYAAICRNTPMSLNLSANSVNAIKGSLGMQYTQQLLASVFSQQFNVGSAQQIANQATLQPGQTAIPTTPTALQSGQATMQIETSTLNLFNPTLNYRFFMIPALMIMLIVMICGFLPALNIVSEKEVGTIEQINVSPIGHVTFTLGKIIPYWIIGFIIINIGIVVAWLVYGLVPNGSTLTIFASTILFIILMSALAVVIANFSQNMQQVMFVMFFIVMLFILMSGLLTPVQSMPQWAQYATYGIPPRYYVDIMRATYLRGASIADQWFSFTMLGIYAIALVAAAILTYKKQN